jgi:cation diffusion facilitator CzcD-associated flavoprotein CzcO
MLAACQKRGGTDTVRPVTGRNGSQQGTQTRVVVVGAGFGGIAAAIELRSHGITDVVILDSAPEIGGTWYYNS